MKEAFEGMDDVKIVIFEPGGEPMDNKANRSSDVPPMTPGRAALIELMDRYLRILLDPFITLLEVHKLMYFMQVSGEPLRLKFVKGIYGPYAQNLRHVLNAIEGHLVSGYADGGDAPGKPLELVPGAVADARVFLEEAEDTRVRMERVSDLIEGFEFSFGLELLSTVHWVTHEERPHTLEDLVQRTYAWNARKKQFSRRQLGIAVDVLSRKGWMETLDMADSQ